jgi:ABC-type sugar transport system substrate-binding protein
VKKFPVRVPHRGSKLLAVLCAAVFILLAVRTLWELQTLGKVINPARTGRYRIKNQFALLFPASDHDLFYTRVYNGMRDLAEQEQAALEIYEYPEGERDEIRKLLRLILNTQPNGVVFSVPPDPFYDDLFKAFLDRGIPLVSLEYDIAYRDVHVGTNPFEQGRLAGEAALNLKSGGDMAVLLSGSNATFIQGFRQILQERGVRDIGLIRSYDDTLAAGEEFIREILSFRTNISVAVFTGSRESEGAAQALIEYGRVGTPLIIAAEDNMEIRQLMELGVISATIVRNPEKAGQAVIEALCALLRDERTNAYVDSGSYVLSAEFVNQLPR